MQKELAQLSTWLNMGSVVSHRIHCEEVKYHGPEISEQINPQTEVPTHPYNNLLLLINLSIILNILLHYLL